MPKNPSSRREPIMIGAILITCKGHKGSSFIKASIGFLAASVLPFLGLLLRPAGIGHLRHFLGEMRDHQEFHDMRSCHVLILTVLLGTKDCPEASTGLELQPWVGFVACICLVG